MIKTIVSSSPNVQVLGGYPSMPYIQTNSTNPMTGQVKFNSGSQCLEIYDGYSWQTMPMGHAMVGLSTDAEAALKWAKEKQKEEQELEELAKTNPTIQDLVDQIKEKQTQIEMVKILIQGQEVGTN
jgi:hypothetical protein